ncbi:Ig-like domain-containing protein, partial [Lysinibacillus fusiformis]
MGETKTLTATVTPANATNKTVTWTSSNVNVASVD